MQTLTPRRRKPGTPPTAAEPRRPLRWSITPDTAWLCYRWQCLACESGTGSAPTHADADRAAATHYAAAHGGAA